jgi:DNA-binding NtrC family response regulator
MDGASTPPVPQARALLVLQEPAEARRVASSLLEKGIEAIVVHDDVSGTNLLDTEMVDAVVCDTRAPRIDGLRLLRIARLRNPDLCAILIATPRDVTLATRAMEEGAHDFQTRPLNLEKIQAVIRRGLDAQKMAREMHELAQRLDRKFGFQNLIGSSGAIVRVYSRILQVCPLEDPVLITGEAGTGRDLVASTIHHNSPRRAGPLVRLDCEATTPDRIDEEIFGRESAIGDRAPKRGRLEIAEDGTLIIARLEAMPIATQARLLRFLTTGSYEREGAEAASTGNVRVIGIAPPDLRGRVEEGKFRADLLDHLRSVTIEMPALRHRRRDIPLLVERFLKESVAEAGRAIDGIQPAAMDRLVRYAWPGNVRELKSVVRGLVLTSPEKGPLDLGDLPEEIRRADVDGEVRIRVGVALADAERRLIEATLLQQKGDRRATAQILGIGLRTLQRRLASYEPRRRR